MAGMGPCSKLTETLTSACDGLAALWQGRLLRCACAAGLIETAIMTLLLARGRGRDVSVTGARKAARAHVLPPPQM